MRAFSPSHRWSRATILGLGLLIGGVTAAACSSGSPSATVKPQGLSGKQAKAYDSSQYTKEDKEAATVLTPQSGSFLAGKTTVTLLGSTTPDNGDVNPYAIWPVTETVGSVTTGDVLVDNFNNKSNDQGTGTTIVDVHPNGQVTVFASLPQDLAGCPGGVGLTTAMVQLKSGYVIVGSLPSTNGKTASGSGCLIVLSPTGQLASTLTGSYLNGPWDETLQDSGTSALLFVTNTLNGITATSSDSTEVDQGDVVRLTLSESATAPPAVTAETQIADGFPEKPDASAFVKGPTGLALGSDGTLYVANNLNNEIDAISDAATRTDSAGTGTVLTQGNQLANPLGLVLAPNGNILAANAVNGKIVEITPSGQQVGEYYAIQDVGQDPPGNGDLFDLAINQAGTGVLFVKDDTNTLALLH